MSHPLPPPAPGSAAPHDRHARRDKRIQSWIFHVLGAAGIAFQLFVKQVVGLGEPDPVIIILSGLIGGSPIMYQLWEHYVKRPS